MSESRLSFKEGVMAAVGLIMAVGLVSRLAGCDSNSEKPQAGEVGPSSATAIARPIENNTSVSESTKASSAEMNTHDLKLEKSNSNGPVKRIEIAVTVASCASISKGTPTFLEEVAAGLKIAKSDVEFLYGKKEIYHSQCSGVVSTSKGQFTCVGAETFKYDFSDDVYLGGTGFTNSNCNPD